MDARRQPLHDDSGSRMYELMRELFPICRASTGPGVRETLARLQRIVPVEIREVPTGTPAFDWQVPREWHIRDAFIADESGRRLVDFQTSNLHVVSNSMPVDETMSWTALRDHVHTLPDRPDWIPFRTSYFEDGWGFCVTHHQYRALEARGERPLQVCIDSSLVDGSLTYGELLLPGAQDDEVLISTHVCHPSLANDNLSGIVVATHLAAALAATDRRYSYRFVFVPATIGAVTWLSQNAERLARVKAGLVLALLGHAGGFTYKRSQRGDTLIDRVAAHVLAHPPSRDAGARVVDFSPDGYDERQYCSPGIDLPMGCLTRTPHGAYPEYHTSADDLSLVRPESLADSLAVCRRMVDLLEHDQVYVNRFPFGEPQLGRRGLYRAYGRAEHVATMQQAVLWVVNQSDGRRSLLDIARRAGLPFERIRQAADLLRTREVIAPRDSAVAGTDEARPHPSSASRPGASR